MASIKKNRFNYSKDTNTNIHLLLILIGKLGAARLKPSDFKLAKNNVFASVLIFPLTNI